MTTQPSSNRNTIIIVVVVVVLLCCCCVAVGVGFAFQQGMLNQFLNSTGTTTQTLFKLIA